MVNKAKHAAMHWGYVVDASQDLAKHASVASGAALGAGLGALGGGATYLARRSMASDDEKEKMSLGRHLLGGAGLGGLAGAGYGYLGALSDRKALTDAMLHPARSKAPTVAGFENSSIMRDPADKRPAQFSESGLVPSTGSSRFRPYDSYLGYDVSPYSPRLRDDVSPFVPWLLGVPPYSPSSHSTSE